jgi:hypothetical protein
MTATIVASKRNVTALPFDDPRDGTSLSGRPRPKFSSDDVPASDRGRRHAAAFGDLFRSVARAGATAAGCAVSADADARSPGARRSSPAPCASACTAMRLAGLDDRARDSDAGSRDETVRVCNGFFAAGTTTVALEAAAAPASSADVVSRAPASFVDWEAISPAPDDGSCAGGDGVLAAFDLTACSAATAGAAGAEAAVAGVSGRATGAVRGGRSIDGST